MIKEDTFYRHLHELSQEYSCEYIILALKQINDQQLLFVSFDGVSLMDDPILKRYILVVEEIEEYLFHPEYGVSEHSELVEIIEKSLNLVKNWMAEKGMFDH